MLLLILIGSNCIPLLLSKRYWGFVLMALNGWEKSPESYRKESADDLDG